MSQNTLNDVVYDDAKNIQPIEDFGENPIEVNGGEYDYILGFFTKSMKDPIAAQNFTLQIYQVARQADISPLDIIQTMEGQTGLELNASLAYYLNGIRSNATLLGVQNIIPPNFYAGRSVLI